MGKKHENTNGSWDHEHEFSCLAWWWSKSHILVIRDAGSVFLKKKFFFLVINWEAKLIKGRGRIMLCACGWWIEGIFHGWFAEQCPYFLLCNSMWARTMVVVAEVVRVIVCVYSVLLVPGRRVVVSRYSVGICWITRCRDKPRSSFCHAEAEISLFDTVTRKRPGSCVRKSFLKSELSKITGGSQGGREFKQWVWWIL